MITSHASSDEAKAIVHGCKMEDLATKCLENAIKMGYNQNNFLFVRGVLKAEKTISFYLVEIPRLRLAT
jgi:hypothetical protein